MYLHCRQYISPLALIVTLLPIAAPARSQTSFDLTLASQYAARGASLSNGPVVQLRAEHDAQSERFAGWYGGGFTSPALIEGVTQAQLTAYAGRAQRITSTLSWDVGATRTAYLRTGEANYHEFYAGLAMQRGSVRLFYSPAYYGEGRSAYLDLNGGYPLSDTVHVSLHAGLLHPFGDYPGASGGVDARIALGTSVAGLSVEAGWQVKAHAYLEGGRPAPALTASASLKF
jgi:uncharacterized protein (TIGR02001 family)